MSVTPDLHYCEHGYAETEHCRTCEIMGVCARCRRIGTESVLAPPRTVSQARKPSQEFAATVLILLAGGYSPIGTLLLYVLGWFGVHGTQYPCYTGRGC